MASPATKIRGIRTRSWLSGADIQGPPMSRRNSAGSFVRFRSLGSGKVRISRCAEWLYGKRKRKRILFMMFRSHAGWLVCGWTEIFSCLKYYEYPRAGGFLFFFLDVTLDYLRRLRSRERVDRPRGHSRKKRCGNSLAILCGFIRHCDE